MACIECPWVYPARAHGFGSTNNGEPRRPEEGSECPSSFRPFGTLRVVFSMFHGLTPMAITFRHFVAMSERRFAANRILTRPSPARTRIEDRIRFGAHSTSRGTPPRIFSFGQERFPQRPP